MFERATTAMLNDKSRDQTRDLLRRFMQHEQSYSDVNSIIKMEKRIATEFPEGTKRKKGKHEREKRRKHK